MTTTLSVTTTPAVVDNNTIRITHQLTINHPVDTPPAPGKAHALTNVSISRPLPTTLATTSGKTITLKDATVGTATASFEAGPGHRQGVALEQNRQGQTITWTFPQIPVNLPVTLTYLVRHQAIEVTTPETSEEA